MVELFQLWRENYILRVYKVFVRLGTGEGAVAHVKLEKVLVSHC